MAMMPWRIGDDLALEGMIEVMIVAAKKPDEMLHIPLVFDNVVPLVSLFSTSLRTFAVRA